MEPTSELTIATAAVASGFIILMTIIGCIVLITLKRMRDSSNLIWAIAFALRGLGSLLIVFRGRIDPLYSLFAANILIVWSIALLFTGTSSFLGQGKRIGALIAYGALSAVLVVWIGSSGLGFGAQVACVSLLEAIPEFASGLILLAGKARSLHLSRKMTAACFFACSAILAVRAAVGFASPTKGSVFEPGLVQILGYVEAILGSSLLAIGLLWMVNTRSGSHETAERRKVGRA